VARFFKNEIPHQLRFLTTIVVAMKHFSISYYLR
jgi:hypothetical protein